MDDPLEDLREGPLDQAFQPLLKALKHTHRLLLWFRDRWYPYAAHPHAHRSAGLVLVFPSLAEHSTLGEVAEWQTRTVQVRVPERA